MASLSSTPTQQTNTVVQPGSTGLIPGLLGGVASNPLVAGFGLSSLGLLPSGSGAANFFTGSDRRIKADIKRVGSMGTKRKVPVYTYRYKSDPANVRRIGVMAQEAEKVSPESVAEHPTAGHKMVNYKTLLDDIFPEKKAA